MVIKDERDSLQLGRTIRCYRLWFGDIVLRTTVISNSPYRVHSKLTRKTVNSLRIGLLKEMGEG